jgi:hypothetical protein
MLGLQNCKTEVLGYEDSKGEFLEWFSDAIGTETNVTLDLFLDNTDLEEFWLENQPWYLSFTYTMISPGSQFFSFEVKGTVEFINACLVNTVSALEPQTFSLANQI